jgi:hypothetical protein
MLEKTITSNNKVRLNPQYPIVAGVDKDNVPRLLRTDDDGRIDLGGVILPEWDSVVLAYFTSTNNVQTAIYKLVGVEVARFTFTYVGGGAADNDRLATATFSKP